MQEQFNDTLDFRRYFRILRQGKWLYALCLAGALVLAIVYAAISKPVYRHYANILIEADEGGGGGLSSLLGNSSMANLFSLSGLGSSTLDDELQVMASHDCFVRTAKTLGLNRMYFERNGLTKDLLFHTSPVLVEAPTEYFDTLLNPLKVNIELEGNGKVSARVSKGFLGWKTLATVEHQPLPCTITWETGSLLLLKSDCYTDEERTIQVNVSGYNGAAFGLESEIVMEQVNKKANAIALSMKHPEKEYAHEVLRAHIQSYREMRKEHKGQKAVRQIGFLDERIGMLMNELDTVQTNMRDFMSGNSLVDVENQTKILLARNEGLQDSILRAETRLQLCRMVSDVLNASPEDFPPLTGMGNDRQIEQYNALVLQRNQLKVSAKEGNSALDVNTQQLTTLRQLVLENMQLTIAQNQQILQRMKAEQAKSASSLGQMPSAGLEYLNRERDLQVKNGLLLFLLQQRENSMMSAMSRSEAGYIFEPPYTAKKKDYSKKIIIAALLFVLAIFGATFLVFGWAMWKNELVDDSDLPSGWREHGRSTANDLRRLLMADTEVQRLYIQPLSGAEQSVAALKDSFLKAGAQYQYLQEQDLASLFELSDVKLNAQQRLVLIVPSRQLKRSEFSRLVAGVDPTYCYVLCQK